MTEINNLHFIFLVYISFQRTDWRRAKISLWSGQASDLNDFTDNSLVPQNIEEHPHEICNRTKPILAVVSSRNFLHVYCSVAVGAPYR